MKSVNVTVRVDEKVKRDFDDFCNNVGLNMTTAFNMYMKAVLRTRELPFSITDDPFYSERNMAHLLRGVEALNAGKGIERDIVEVD